MEFLKNSIKAKLIFEISPKKPTHLLVYLHLVEMGGGLTEWLADPASGIDCEVLDPGSKPLAQAPGLRTLSLISQPFTLSMPGNSRLDLLISQDWDIDNPSGGYVLSLADRVWFIPRDKAGEYTLRVKFPGIFPVPEKSSQPLPKPWILFEIPPQKIVITPTPD